MEYAVSTQGLTRKFGEFTAVDNLNLDIRPGEICGFLGPNGAGKSTAIRMLCAILEPSAGTAQVGGYDVVRESEKVKQRIGYMSQKFSLYEDLTVRENLEFFAGMYGLTGGKRQHRIDEMTEMAGLVSSQGELVSALSRGFRQRLALGCAIIAHPAIVFLDEPTSGVSPTSRREFFSIIKELSGAGTTFIVSTHFMDEAERCHRIAFMSGGHLLDFASPGELKQKGLPGVLTEVTPRSLNASLEKADGLKYVRDWSLHGPLLHVLIDNRDNLARLEEDLEGEARVITPSLEDIFVHLSREGRE